MHNFFRLLILRGWSNHFRRGVGLCFRLTVALFELDYHYSPLLAKAAQTLLDNPRFKNLKKVHQVSSILKVVHAEEKGDFDYSGLVERYDEKLRSREDYRWRYNADQGRFYSYSEMKAKREDTDLSACEHFFEGFVPCPEEDKRVWQEHWINLVMKRDIIKYIRKFRDLERKRIPYEIDFDNFNPSRPLENIKLLTTRSSADVDFFFESEDEIDTNVYSDEEDE